MQTEIIMMSDAYVYQDFYKDISDVHITDCRDLSGTRCYLDENSKAVLTTRFEDVPVHAVHFIDSGNYHYLSLLMLQKIDTDFNLILFDHHPDDQPPSFGDITSCGGWVLEAKESLSHLKKVYTFGMEQPLDINSIPTNLPVYVSLDKDILDPLDTVTDWDQGTMRSDELKSLIEHIISNYKLLGFDICGDASENPSDCAQKNSKLNSNLLELLRHIA